MADEKHPESAGEALREAFEHMAGAAQRYVAALNEAWRPMLAAMAQVKVPPSLLPIQPRPAPPVIKVELPELLRAVSAAEQAGDKGWKP